MRRSASILAPGGIRARADFNFAHIKRFAQKLEAGKFDAFFAADHLAVLNMPMDALKRSATVTSFNDDAATGASRDAEHLGLIATGSTTYEEPFHVARRFASLDHISGGRAAWNVVTTSNPNASLNFGIEAQMEHDERYHRAREFYDVVIGLWDVGRTTRSFAMSRRVSISIPNAYTLDHKGKYFSVRGRLILAGQCRAIPSSCRRV